MSWVGLVLEGGGMRGLYTVGVLEYFLKKQLFFPYVIGVSAGACMAPSYLSRQEGRNKKLNIGLANDPRYSSYRNLLTKCQLFGMNFLFDEILKKVVPFDFNTLLHSEEKFVVGTTDSHMGEPIYFNKEEQVNEMKIAGLGDSITYGYPYGPENSWLAQLGEKLDVVTVNHGVNAELTEEILRRVPNVIADEPDVVIIMGGTNDAYDQLVPQIVASNLQKMITQLRQSDYIKYIFIGIPPIVVGTGTEQWLDSYRVRMKTLAENENIGIIDFNQALSSKGIGFLMDSCHPNKVGYEKMAEEAYEVLSKWIKRS